MSPARPAQGDARLFGTDGVRGLANNLLTPELALRLGRAGGYALVVGGAANQRVVLGRDPRVSGDMLGAALAAGLMSVGLDVIDLGIFPTPGIAFMTRALPAAAGVMISASHNPFADNGIKFFGPDGAKLTDEREDEIAAYVRAGEDVLPRPTGRGVGTLLRESGANAAETYIRHVAGTVTSRFDGLDVVLDCANGAVTGFARKIFERLGARVIELAAQPDGANINEGYGSTHPGPLQAVVTEHGANIGFAFDGDGDRVVVVDRGGAVVDGDGILALCGLDLLRRGQLPGRAIVATVMSNLGLDAAFAAAGGKVIRTPVGDRYVHAAMAEQAIILGGEQAGHILFLEHNTTGDGLITAVQVLHTLVSGRKDLAEALSDVTWYPQVQRGVRFDDAALARQAAREAGVTAARQRIECQLGASGRVVLRPSGTEPLVRIMVEAPSRDVAERYAAELEEVVRASAMGLAAR